MSAGMSAGVGVRAAGALCGREWLRFARQPSRIVASVGTPLLLWLFAGAGLGGSVITGAVAGDAAEGAGYAAFLLPGMVTMTILFSTVFASISLIQDRHAGFLQSALVSPAPAWAIVFAKVAGGATIATAQAAMLLCGAWFVGLSPGVWGYLGAVLASGLTAAAVIGLGLSAAWWVNSSSGFHGVMNMVLMPMWLLSGALFPVEGASEWLAFLVRINPLHWATLAISGSLGISQAGTGPGVWIGAAVFAAAMFALASLVMTRQSGRLGASAQMQE